MKRFVVWLIALLYVTVGCLTTRSLYHIAQLGIDDSGSGLLSFLISIIFKSQPLVWALLGALCASLVVALGLRASSWLFNIVSVFILLLAIFILSGLVFMALTSPVYTLVK